MSAQTELKDLMLQYNSRFPNNEKASMIEEVTDKGFILTFRISESKKYVVDLKHEKGTSHMTDKKLYGFKQSGYTALLGILAAQFVLDKEIHGATQVIHSEVPVIK